MNWGTTCRKLSVILMDFVQGTAPNGVGSCLELTRGVACVSGTGDAGQGRKDVKNLRALLHNVGIYKYEILMDV